MEIKAKILFNKIKIISFTLSFLSLISIIIAFISIEVNAKSTCSTSSKTTLFDRIQQSDLNALYNLLSIFANNIISILIFINIFLKHTLRLSRDVISKTINPLTTLRDTNYSLPLIIELILVIPQPLIPFIDKCISCKIVSSLSTQYELNEILATIMLLRLYFIVDGVLYLSGYKSQTVYQICNMFCDSNTLDKFIIKSVFNMHPIFFIVFIGISMLIILTVLIHTYEQPISLDERKIEYVSDQNGSELISIDDFTDYGNCFWCIIIAMTAIGYSDYVPLTSVGKIIVMISTMTGIFLMSMLIVSIFRLLAVDDQHKNIMRFMKRMELSDKIKELDNEIMKTMMYRGYLVYIHNKGKENERKKIIAMEAKGKSLICLRKKLVYDAKNATNEYMLKERIIEKVNVFWKSISESYNKLKYNLERIEKALKDKRDIIINLQINVFKRKQQKMIGYIENEKKSKKTKKSKKK